jgi:predicted DNA-binding protein (MmcQ/YjbR family)
VDAVIARIREVCLAFAQSEERETWGHPTFRVRNKIFATCGAVEAPDGVEVHVMTMKAAPGEQESLLAEGHPFFYPNYVGSKGWIGVAVGPDTDWQEVHELVEDSFRQIAPKRVVAEFDSEE